MSAPTLPLSPTRERSAAAWMLVSVGCFSAIPVLMWLGVQDMSPWVLAVVWNAAGALLYVPVREFTAAERGNGGWAIRGDLQATSRALLGCVTLCQMCWPLFSVALMLADPSVVTLICESWPLAFGVIVMTRAWRSRMLDGHNPPANDTRYRMTAVLVLLMVGAAGVSLAILSDTDSLSWSESAPVGLILAAVVALAGAGGGAAGQAAGKLQRPGLPRRSLAAVSVSSIAAAKVLALPLLCVVAVAAPTGAPTVTARALVAAVACAGLQMGGSWCWQQANHLAREASRETAFGINALYSLAPVGALLLLAAFADTAIERPALLVAGTSLVVAANAAMLRFRIDGHRTVEVL